MIRWVARIKSTSFRFLLQMLKTSGYGVIILSILFCGCISSGGDIELEGKVTDEYTKAELPRRNIIVQALERSNGKISPRELGQFSTDSSGRFRYTLKKIKDVRHYNFVLVGDSGYAFKTKKLNIYELEQNGKILSFSLNKLAYLSIIINRVTQKPHYDTLSLKWVSDNIFYWSLFPYEIYNHDTSNRNIAIAGKELRWFGGHVNSVVNTMVFAEKQTKIFWDLDRNGKRFEFIDTITCKRDIINRIYFSY